MSSATLTPYYNATQQETYPLVSENAAGARWALAGRSIAQPKQIEVIRKVTASNAGANDHVVLRFSFTNRNATTYKLSTGAITLDISIPKDTGAVTAANLIEMVKEFGSLLNDSAAVGATSVNATALVEGRNL